MFHLQLVFETRFTRCISLDEVRDLLHLRSLCKCMCSLLSHELVTTYIRNLVHEIRMYCTVNQADTSTMDVKAHQQFLIRMHHLGVRIQSVPFDQKCVIAGTFCMNLYMLCLSPEYHITAGKFDKSVISIYHNSRSDLVYEELCKKTSISRGRVLKYNTDQEFIIDKEDVQDWLQEQHKWNQYDWEQLLNDMPPHFTFGNEVISKQDCLSKAGCLLYKIISTKHPWNCKHCFTMNVFHLFDMIPCCVAILGIRGTFYPDLFMTPASRKCIRERKIQFGWCAFRQKRKQLHRINKYKTLGFEL